MKLNFRQLGHKGHLHIVIPIIAVVAVGAIGYITLNHSHAQTIGWRGMLEEGKQGRLSSSFCLTASSGNKGASVVLDPCSTTANNNQIWTINDIRITNVLNGTNVQEFSVQSAVGNNMCLDNWGQSKAKSFPVRLYTCDTSNMAVTWIWGGRFTSQGFSAHQMANLGSSTKVSDAMCLDDEWSSHMSNNKVGTYTCKKTSQANQEWFETPAPNKTTSPGGGLNNNSKESITTTLYSGQNDTDWQKIENAAPTVKYAIVNICAPDGSGSGCGRPADEKDTSWQPLINALRAKHITPLYYISTNYGQLPLTTIESELTNAKNWYGITSPMFDTTATNNSSYYNSLYSFSVGLGATVVMYNPGTQIPQSYMFGPKVIQQVFEGSASDFSKSSYPSWMKNYPANEFSATISTGTSSTIGPDVDHATGSNIGNFYEDDENEPPNYSTLPAFWLTEVNDIANVK